jgi:hypothetical protein
MLRLVAFSICFVAAQPGVSQTVSVIPSGVPGVEVIGSTAAEYETVANRFFGPIRPPSLSDWMPFALAITNRTSQNIVAIAVRWQLMSGKSQIGASGLEHEGFEQRSLQLCPGKTAVALPQSMLFEGGQLPPYFQHASPAPTAARSNELQKFRSAENVVATLDGVVFASGKFVGPDCAREYEFYVPAKVAANVLSMRATGEPVANIEAWLKATAAQPVNPKSENAQSVHVASLTARQLLKSYQRGGEVLLYDTAQGIPQKSPIHIYR